MDSLELSKISTTRSFTYLAMTHVALVVLAVAIAVFWQQPTALVLAAPSLLILISGYFEPTPGRARVSASIDRPRALEGDSVEITVAVRNRAAIPLLDVEFIPHKKLDHEGSLRSISSAAPDKSSVFVFNVIVDEWGVAELGHIQTRVRDRFGLLAVRTRHRIVTMVRVHIFEEAARSLTEPDRFRRLVGSHLSLERGDGCEIADVRPYQPGDRLQSLNWRISARNDEPWVTLRHPDRSTTIVLLLDAYQRFGQQRADGLRRSIRATLGLSRMHLNAQDPVGMLIVGQGVRWLQPEIGRLHLHRLTDALLDLSGSKWAEGRQSQSLVHRLIPKDAVVIAISPLIDQRFTNVVKSLRGRGQSVQVIEPVTHWPNYTVARRGRHEFVPERSWKLYSMYRQVERRRLGESGVPVIPWDEGQPIESALLGLRASQRARGAGAMR